MYNYSLMNNASRLLLISQSRPDAATADRTNTCTRTYTLIYSDVRTHRMSTENDVTRCVTSETCVHAKRVRTHSSRETRVK